MKISVHFLLVLFLSGCTLPIVKNDSYTFAQKCRSDKNLRYYLTYDVDSKKYSDRVTAFLSHKDVEKLLEGKICLIERTAKPIKPPPVKAATPKPRKNFFWRERGGKMRD